MDLEAKLRLVTEVMRTTKEGWVATKPENTDLLIYTHVWRGDDLVVTLVSPLDRDVGLQAAHMAAVGFSATTLSLSFESFHTTLEHSPITGERWMHQEMQYVFETDPLAAEKGWVNECITTAIRDREGGCLMSSLAYMVHDDKVEWLEGDDWLKASSDGGEPHGFMHEMLSKAMAAPTMDQQLSEDGPYKEMTEALVGSDDEVRYYHTDVACIRTLIERKLIVSAILNAEPGSRRAGWIQERFGSSTIEST